MATLAERHRAAQDALANRLAAYIQRSWRTQMKGVPTPTMSEEWIASMAAIIRMYRDRSEGTAAIYYDRERFAQIPDARAFGGAAADELDDDALATSLDVTGRIHVLQALEDQKHDLAEALQLAEKSVAGAATRLALDGGRTYSFNAIQQDSAALGYYRVTKEKCCYFCAMLASRGAVYKADSFDESDARFFGPGDAKVHDHCNCTMGGIWSPKAPVPDWNATLDHIWQDATRGLSGQKAINAFRNTYEAQFGRRDR